MIRVVEIVLIMTVSTLVVASVDVTSLKQLPPADLTSGLGYELLLATIEAMQQDIVDTRQQVSEQRQLFDVLKTEIDRKQQIIEKKLQEVLKRGLVDLKKQIQDSLHNDSSSAEQVQHSIEKLGNRTEQTLNQLKQSVKNDMEDLDKRMQQRIYELQNKAPSNQFERYSIRSSMPNFTAPADNRVYGSCQEAQTSGVKTIKPPTSGIPSFKVLCEHNLWGNWMVIHRRFDGSLDFNRNWLDYRNGFGTMDSEYWLGLEKMHRITSSGNYELLIAMKRSDGSDWYAYYQQIVVGSSAEQYKLRLSGFYRGSVSDSMASSNGMAFSTPDIDNDLVPGANCAQAYSSGWWFNKCFHANLNGIYGRGRIDDTMQWNGFGDKECLKEVMMMIRPSQNINQNGAMMSGSGPGSGYYFSQHSFSSSSSSFS